MRLLKVAGLPDISTLRIPMRDYEFSFSSFSDDSKALRIPMRDYEVQGSENRVFYSGVTNPHEGL